MALVTLMTKRGNMLVAQDAIAIEGMQKIKNGQRVRVQITVPRNLRHHNLLFALLNKVFKSQPDPIIFPTTKSLLNTLKIATGHVEEVIDIENGQVRYIPSSIDFASLDQVAFSEWFDAAVNVVLTRILPNCRREDLENEIYSMLGEAGPADMRGN